MTFKLGLGRSLLVLWREQTELDRQLAQRELKKNAPTVTERGA